MSALATALRRRSAHVMTLLLVTMLSGCWLQVANKGDSGGTVRSTTVPSGNTEPVIICGAAANKCAGYQQVGLEQLVATPEPGYVFDGWSGACEGTAGATCTLDVTQNSSISTRAYFNYAAVSIAAIDDQSLLLNFAPFSLQANASSSAGSVSYSVSNSRPDAVDVSIDPASGQLSLSPLTD